MRREESTGSYERNKESSIGKERVRGGRGWGGGRGADMNFQSLCESGCVKGGSMYSMNMIDNGSEKVLDRTIQHGN